MNAFRITGAASADLDAIGDFIRRDNPVRADSFVDELASRIEVVAERPLSFPARPEIARGVRSAVYGSYLILFRFEDDEVVILRVVNGARDLENLF